MRDPPTRQIVIYDGRECADDWMPFNLAKAIDWLRAKLEEVPEEYRDAAQVDVACVSNYEDGWDPRILISYFRPETDAEATERTSSERRRDELTRQAALQTIHELDRKWGRR